MIIFVFVNIAAQTQECTVLCEMQELMPEDHVLNQVTDSTP